MKILDSKEAVSALQSVGVDVIALVDSHESIFEDGVAIWVYNVLRGKLLSSAQ